MNKQEIAQGLSQFVMMAFIGPQNIETGFLTHHSGRATITSSH